MHFYKDKFKAIAFFVVKAEEVSVEKLNLPKINVRESVILFVKMEEILVFRKS